jgi:ketol-acid reductoisomerase
MLSNDFMATIKSVIGTCQALGVLIENKETKEIMQDIKDGKFAEEISAKKTDVDSEKRKELDAHFKAVFSEQEAVKKAEEEEKAAEEEKKAETAATTTEEEPEEKK